MECIVIDHGYDEDKQLRKTAAVGNRALARKGGP